MIHLVLIYIVIFLGVFTEGELIYVSSVIAAHQGHLNLWIVGFLGFVATVSSDMFYYHIGRKYGKKWLEKRTGLYGKAEKASKMMTRRKTFVLLAYRFLYGFRIVIPILIGSQGIEKKIFISYSIAGVIIWISVLTSFGFWFGLAIKSFMNEIKMAEFYIIGALILTAVILNLVKYIRSE